ncbi:hypothetical protein ACOCJ7_03810 [Knoellia sp. CPCC 206453]|uniref:hypothetical protein n=1 Tax=Knoellia pratensis TaxID=3404796 RepID=UPI00360D9F85
MSALVAVSAGSIIRAALPERVVLVVLGAFAVTVVTAELMGRRLPLPQNARQVPRSIVFDDPRWGPFQFGFEMGTGVRTFVPTGLPHLLALGLILAAPWYAALLAGVGFGIGRGFMSTSRTKSGDVGWWDIRYQRTRRLNVAVLSLVALVSAVTIAVMSW